MVGRGETLKGPIQVEQDSLHLGQLWGNPLYKWDAHKKSNYEWWISRVDYALKLYDLLRIDHFRGFSAYFSIPYGDKNALRGKWIKGPGNGSLSKEGKHTYNLPTPLHDGSLNFSYSGLKTAVINLVNNEKARGNEIRVADLCKSFQDTAVGMVMDRLERAIKQYKIKQVVLAGGVSANSYLREQMHKRLDGTNIDLIVPPIWCTTDNAAMIVRLAEHLWKMGVTCDTSVSCDPNWRIDKYKTF